MDSAAGLTRFKTKPYHHQLDCLNRFGSHTAFALLAEQGTGKTFIIINNLAELWAGARCDAALVLAPNGVHSNWTANELPKHMPDWVRYKAVAWSAGANKKEWLLIQSILAQSKNELRILTMNWEALQSKRGYEFAKQFLETTYKAMIVCDESDAIKNPSAARTKSLMLLRKHSSWRRIMTGTPYNNAPFDLFSQYSFLDESILGTTSFYAFKAEYAEMLHPGHPLLVAIQRKAGGSHRVPQVVAQVNGKPKYKNLDRLTRLIEPHSFRVLKKDCLDLPEKIYKTLVFQLTPQQREVYKKAKEECRVLYEGRETPFNQLVALQKLAQITSGYYLHPAAEEPVRIPGENPKLDMLVERATKLIEQGEKLIIWARYRVEIADIAVRLKEKGLKVGQYHGGVKTAERAKVIEEFNATYNGLDVFLGNQQAGGTGINLVAASSVLYFSNDFSLRNRLQSEDRAHRIGQTKNVVYYNFVGKGTIDEGVVKALIFKQDVADVILGELK